MEPLVTVLITSYNQQDYIGQAVESVLAQKTNFHYEIYLSDDASTDGTPEIIKSYEARYPRRVRCLLRKQNVGISRNWFEGLAAGRGRYITTLEGDDYWLYEEKLQRQVDFLKQNPEYTAVSHRLQLVDQRGKPGASLPKDRRIVGRDAGMEWFLGGITFSCTATLWYNFVKDDPERYRSVVTANRSIADFALCMLMLDAGPVKVLDESWAAYRYFIEDGQHQNYNASRGMLEKYADHLEAVMACERFFQGKYDFLPQYVHASFYPWYETRKTPQKEVFHALYSTLPAAAQAACKAQYPWRALKEDTWRFLAKLYQKARKAERK